MSNKLTPELNEAFWGLIEKSTDESEKGNIAESYSLMLKAWESIPEPKEQFDVSFVAAKCISGMYLRDGNFEEALKWAEILQACDMERPETGEREIMKAMVYFETGNLEESRRLFEIVNSRSEGRLWKSIDKKYFKFFKSKK